MEPTMSLESMHRDLREILERQGLNVQAQDKYLLITAVDQRGKQTRNRDVKTAGGIKSWRQDSWWYQII